MLLVTLDSAAHGLSARFLGRRVWQPEDAENCAVSDSGYLGAWCGVYSRKDPLEEGMATHSSILAWRIPMGILRGARWGEGSQNVARD